MGKLSTWFRRTPYLIFWLASFCLAGAIALTVQLIMLPYVFPSLHAGNGLLAGGDWVGYHQIATELARKIHAQGWSVWELRPHGHSPAGIAAAIYALTVSEPYVLIPLNAALHATAGVALMRIARYLTDDDFTAMCAALPFVMFPSAMAWYAQIGKDGFYFAGAFLCLYGWVRLARLPTWRAGWISVAGALAWLGAGLALMGLVRIYSFQVMQAMGLIFAVGVSVLFIVRGAKGLLPWKNCGIAIATLFLVPLLLRLAPIDQKLSYTVSETTPAVSSTVCHGKNGETLVKDCWRPSGWLPHAIENIFLRLAVQREDYIDREPYLDRRSGSMVDGDVRILGAVDFLVYLPRAGQVGFLAPFPEQWISPGVSPGGSLMRRVVGVEMMGVYGALLFLPYVLWRWRRKAEMWLPFVFGAAMVMIYALSTPNLGTLHRQRYGFLMLLVGMGLAGCVNALRLRKVIKGSAQ